MIPKRGTLNSAAGGHEKIFVAGSNGLVGSAIVRRFQAGGWTNLLLPEINELDLTDQRAVGAFFEKEKPEYVILAAAKVGGIHANNTYPADFIYLNQMIQNNAIHHAYRNGVKRLLFLGSSCIYPQLAPQPMQCRTRSQRSEVRGQKDPEIRNQKSEVKGQKDRRPEIPWTQRSD